MKTLAHKWLDREAEIVDVPQRTYDTLDSLLDKAKEIDANRNPRDVLKDIGCLLEKKGFNYKALRVIKGILIIDSDFGLSRALEEKQLACLTAPILYYSIGELLGLKLHFVKAPRHYFIRCNDVNWETTANCELTDDYYISFFKISEISIKNQIYLSNLTVEQVEAITYYNCRLLRLLNGDLEGAVKDISKAIELDSECPWFYVSRATDNYDKKNFDSSIEDCNKALEFDPKYALTYLCRANAKLEKGNFEAAIEDYSKVIELDSNLAWAYSNRAVAKMRKGDTAGALSDCDKASELDPELGERHVTKIRELLRNN